MELRFASDPDQEENQVLQREEKLRSDILNAFHEVVAVYSPTHDFIWLNDAGKRQLNIKDDTYIGKLCHKVWFGTEGPCPNCPVVSKTMVPAERILTFAFSGVTPPPYCRITGYG